MTIMMITSMINQNRHSTKVNNEGMTFREWFLAAFFTEDEMWFDGDLHLKARTAWINGEDPSEWRVWNEARRQKS